MQLKHRSVLLISPNRTVPKVENKRIAPPLGLLYIASVLEKNGINVSILDTALEGYANEKEINDRILYGLDDDKIIDKINQINPDIIGITFSFSSEIGNIYHLCRLIKNFNKNIKVVVGGIHPSFSTQFTLENKDIDYVIRGEGEYAFLNLISNKLDSKGIAFRKNNSMKIPPFSDFVDVNKLPFPAWHLVDIEKYIKINKFHSPYAKHSRVMNIITSRGCFGRCIYCSSSNFFGHAVRGRITENILQEINLLVDKYNIKEIQFEDDNVAFDRNRFVDLLQGLKKIAIEWCLPNGMRVDTVNEELLELMAESGCYQVTFGIESGSEEILRFIKKPLKLDRIKPLIDRAKELGILTHTFFMIGFPNETKEQMEQTVKFAEYLNPDSASFAIVTPLIGTELFDMCKIKESFEYFENSFYDSSDRELEEKVNELNARFKNLDRFKKNQCQVQQ